MSNDAQSVPRRSPHRAWLMLVVCCLMYGSALGVIGNTAGLYLSPVSEDMGWELSSLNLYLTIVSITMTVMFPVAGWILPRKGIRFVVAGALTLDALTYGLSSLFTELWHWYTAGVMLGIAYAFLLYIPMPLILNNWFARRNGLAIGIASAFASLVAAGANPIAGSLIESVGWRQTRIIYAVVAWLLAVPAILLFMRLSPADLGMRPYGAGQVAAGGSSSSAAAPLGISIRVASAVRSFPFWAAIVMAGLFALAASMLQQVPSVAASLGFATTVGGWGVSFIMFGGIIGKLALGWIHDRFRIRITTYLAAILGVSGAAIALLGGANIVTFLLGCALFGGAYASLTIVPPLAVRALFGTTNYSKIYSFVTVSLGAFSALAPFLYSRIHDVTGSFNGAWMVCMAAYILAALLLAAAVPTARRLAADPNAVEGEPPPAAPTAASAPSNGRSQ